MVTTKKPRGDAPAGTNIYAQLMSATARGDEVALQHLIPQAKSAGILNDNLLRLGLQNACKKGKVSAARLLLAEGAPTNLTGTKGSPALFWACTQPQTKGHTEVIKTLLSREYKSCPADTEWKDEDHGRTILMAAAWRGHNDALRLLLSNGANFNETDDDGRTVMHNLATDKRCRWNEETVRILLEHDVDVDAKDRQTRTALHWAVSTNKPNLVAQLLTRKAHRTPNVNAKTGRGKTALHLACRSDPGVPAIVGMLLEHGANALHTSDGQWTCLHNTAKRQKQAEIAHLLLEREPSLINAKTSTGMTVCDDAQRSSCSGKRTY